jgi:hypothetical protein
MVQKLVNFIGWRWWGGCNECKEHSQKQYQEWTYVAGNGVEALDMLRTVIDPLPKIILILICLNEWNRILKNWDRRKV